MIKVRSLTLAFGLVLLTLAWIRSASAYGFFDSVSSEKNKHIWNIEKKNNMGERHEYYDFLGNKFAQAQQSLNIGNPRLPWSNRYYSHSALVRATCDAVFGSPDEAGVSFVLNYNSEGRGSKIRSSKAGHHLVSLVYESPSNMRDSLVTQTYESVLFNTLTSGVYNSKSYVALIYPMEEGQNSSRTGPPVRVRYMLAKDLCYKLSGGFNSGGFIRTYVDFSAPDMTDMERVVREFPPHFALNYGLENILLETLDAEAYMRGKNMGHRILDRIATLNNSNVLEHEYPVFAEEVKPTDHALAFALGTMDFLLFIDSYTSSQYMDNKLRNNAVRGVPHYCGTIRKFNTENNMCVLESGSFKKYMTMKHTLGGCMLPSDVKSYTATLMSIMNPSKVLVIDYYSKDEDSSKRSKNKENTYIKEYFGCYDIIPRSHLQNDDKKDIFNSCKGENVKQNLYSYCTTVKATHAVRRIGKFSQDSEDPSDILIMQLSKDGINPFTMPKVSKRFILEFLNSVESKVLDVYSDQFKNSCIPGPAVPNIRKIIFSRGHLDGDIDYNFNDGLYIWNSGVQQGLASSSDKNNPTQNVSVMDNLTHEQALSPVIVESPLPENLPKVIKPPTLMNISPEVPYSRANSKLFYYMNRYKDLRSSYTSCVDNPAELMLTDVIIPLPKVKTKNPLDVILSYYFKGYKRSDVLMGYPGVIRSSPFFEAIDIPRDEACDVNIEDMGMVAQQVIWGSITYEKFPQKLCRNPSDFGPYFITPDFLASANVVLLNTTRTYFT